VDEQFNGNQIALGGATRNTAAVSKAPSGMTLVLALGIVPIVIGVLLVGGLRRRRHAMF
jgi:large exoprotein involved in heme utilization and adhesion